MGAANSWRIPIDFKDWMQNIEKRMLNEERRPLISSATDLMGPGAGPFANRVLDWNSDEAAFTGVFYSVPEGGQANSPDNTLSWIGEVFSIEDGSGFQRLTQFWPNTSTADIPGWPGSVVPLVRRRHFVSPTGQRAYSTWEAV
jgi:hypothetical protein